jgi:asparagine synthase (glutamine-hydrolysing)
MCGVAGILHGDGKPVDPGSLRRMARLLQHRGPDATGYWQRGSIGLAHTRLRIVDIGDSSAQPMESPGGEVALSYNGEIHNFEALRSELETLGYGFRTEGDVEVVLTAYRQWGRGAFERFNGMWAIAIWDQPRRRLLLSRDRFGIKPLYYTAKKNQVIFASEPKAILAAMGATARANEAEILSYLRNATTDFGNATFFEHILAVSPATCVTFGDAGECVTEVYWKLPLSEGVVDPATATDRFRELFDDSVRLRMRSDVPVGAALSGGLDSSAVVTVAAGLHEQLDCFSLRYPGQPYDESSHAKAVADACQARLHWVEPRPEETMNLMREIVWHHDSPPPMRGRLPQWAVMRAAREHVTVILEGHGGDELLAGYAYFLAPYMADGLNRLAGRPSLTGLHRMLSDFVTMNRVQSSRRSLPHTLVRNFVRGVLSRGTWQPFLDRNFTADRAPIDPLRLRSSWNSKWLSLPFASNLNNALWLEFFHCGLPESLHAADAASMAFSLESRAPFLDHRLVEYCFSLGSEHKISNGTTKKILRDSFRRRLPASILERKVKLGFPAPYAEWLTQSAAYDELVAMLLSDVCLSRGIYDAKALRRCLGSRRRGLEFVRGHVGILWRMLALEIWYRQFIDQPASELSV